MVYTPEMIVLEKLRALCQSIPEYKTIIPSANIKGRARDFYDIWNICEMYPIDFPFVNPYTVAVILKI